MFIAGKDDPVIRGQTVESLTTGMQTTAKELRGVTIIPDAGHWIQQERPDQVNAMLISFLNGLKK